jgi:adenine-specific DNA-methyltransferase
VPARAWAAGRGQAILRCVIKYLGSKRTLVPKIVAVARALAPAGTVLDLFSGTARVGHALKAAGYRVVANDHLAYAATLARCYVQADRARVQAEVERLLPEMAAVAPRPGYITAQYCEAARYFQPRNGARIDAMRDWIAARALDPEVEAVLLTSLMEAADRVDSTTGVQMAYLKRWAPRAHNEIAPRLPALLDGPGTALQMDALAAAADVDADIAYLDPPYNQHSYLGNYHIWESLVRWDQPAVYGVARKRVDCRAYASPFNSRRRIHAALRALVETVRARHLIVSFNNEGYVSRAELEELLGSRGHVTVIEVDFKRYVGAQIGIYNPSGEKVGRVSHLRNREYLFAVSPDRAAVERVRAAVESAPAQVALL